MRAAVLLLVVLTRAQGAPLEAPRAPRGVPLQLALPFAGAGAPALAAQADPRLTPVLPAAPAAAPAAASAAASAALPPRGFPGPGVYERRSVGLLAVDFKDSTSLHLSDGNRRARALIGATLDFAADAAARFDGSVVRRLGDGFVAAFPRHSQALAAAREVQRGLPGLRRRLGEPRLQLRAGVHAGRVLVDATGPTPEVYGQAVEEALELVERAGPGQIATADAVETPPTPPRREAPPFQPPLSLSAFTKAATLFTSLEGWPGAYEVLGRRRAFEATKAFHAHVAGIVRRHGGFVVKTEGETVMASFPSPADAVAAGLELQRRLGELGDRAPLGKSLRARVGISYGRVLREDRLEGPDFFGNTVNAAARLMKLARGGEVAVSGSVLADPAAARPFAGARREQARLKGFSEPVVVARLSP